MSRGKETIDVAPVAGSTLTTRRVSVRECVRSVVLSTPVIRMVIRLCSLAGVAKGGTW